MVILAFIAQAGLDEVLLGVTFGQRGTCQRIGLIGTVTQMELFQYVISESTLAEIGQTYGAALLRVKQSVLKEIQRKLIGYEQ